MNITIGDSQQSEMDFVIEENINDHGLGYRAMEVLLNIFRYTLLLCLTPILIISSILEKFKRTQSLPLANDWRHFKEFNGVKLSRKYIDENELPDSLDYPVEVNDIHLCYYSSEPKIPELKDKYFDIMNQTESENGFYLISFNEKGKGMTLWCSHKKKITMQKVKELESQWWDLSIDKNKLIHLEARDKNHNYHFKIKENYV